METLSVKNFLVIKEAKFDVGKINLIIGPQANGKSVLAKLLYFFRFYMSTIFIFSINSTDGIAEVNNLGLFIFKECFPEYTWKKQTLNIVYKINDFEITLSNNDKLQISVSRNLKELHNNLTSEYKKKIISTQEEMKILGITEELYPFLTFINKNVFNDHLGACFQRSLFIPAGRSFYSYLRDNILEILADKSNIDYFIKNFVSNYRNIKELFIKSQHSNEKMNEGYKNKSGKILEAVLSGRYEFEDSADWIIRDNKKINLSNASSGQQEALPILLYMLIWPITYYNKKYTYFIEEPEAHLFPISQKHIVSLFALVYNHFNHDFVITTHSPYILTAINNMILTKDLIKEKGEAKVKKIVDVDFSINYEDVRAYTIENGKLISILDDESRLIGASVIDSVSDEFDKVFDGLLKLRAGN